MPGTICGACLESGPKRRHVYSCSTLIALSCLLTPVEIRRSRSFLNRPNSKAESRLRGHCNCSRNGSISKKLSVQDLLRKLELGASTAGKAVLVLLGLSRSFGSCAFKVKATSVRLRQVRLVLDRLHRQCRVRRTRQPASTTRHVRGSSQVGRIRGDHRGCCGLPPVFRSEPATYSARC